MWYLGVRLRPSIKLSGKDLLLVKQQRLWLAGALAAMPTDVVVVEES